MNAPVGNHAEELARTHAANVAWDELPSHLIKAINRLHLAQATLMDGDLEAALGWVEATLSVANKIHLCRNAIKRSLPNGEAVK